MIWKFFIALYIATLSLSAQDATILSESDAKRIYESGVEFKLPASLTDPKQVFSSSMNTTYDLVKSIDPSLWNVTSQWKEYFKAEEQMRNEARPTFFLFFTVGESGSVVSGGLPYFTVMAAKLKRKHPYMNFIGVLRGFPKDKARTIELFSSEAKAGNGTAAGVKIKFMPTMFDELRIERAPAYAFANCKKGFGTKGGCDFKYLVRGGVGLDGLLDLMADHNSSYKGWAFDVRDTE